MKTRACQFVSVVMMCFAAQSLAEELQTPPGDKSDSAKPKDEDILAVVNGEPLFAEDLEQILNAIHTGRAEQERSFYEPARLLERAIDDVLVAQEGRALGLHREDPLTTRLAKLRESWAVERLQREEITEKIEVSDEEITTAFEKLYETATFRMITLDDEESAHKLKAEIGAATDFVVLAQERSIDHKRSRGGLMENLDRIDIPVTIASEVFKAAPGDVVGPVITALGWSILRVEATSPADPERYDRLEPELRKLLWSRKASSRRRQFGQELRRTHSVEVEQQTVDSIVCEKLPDGRLAPKIENQQASVAGVDDREVSAGQLVGALEKRWRRVKNEQAALAVIPRVLDILIDDELLASEAERRGYLGSAEVDRRVRAREGQMVIVSYISEIVSPKIEVSEQEVEQSYSDRRKEFRRPPRLHLSQITVASQEEAESLAGLLRQGTDMTWLARQHSIDRFRDVGGARGWYVPTPGVDSIQDALLAAQPAEVLDPFGTPGNFILLRVDAREEQGYFGLEEMAPRLRAILFDQKRDEAVTELVTELRSRSEIEVFEDALARMQIEASQRASEAPPAHGGG